MFQYCSIPSRRNWVIIFILAIFSTASLAAAESSEVGSEAKIVGMYVHQHWPYHRPYAARSWTLDDWKGYIEGLHRLGFNTIKIWPVLETIPNPLTPSDAANLEKITRVIDAIHAKGMKVIIALCPNVVADSAVASQMTFEDRYFFYSDMRVNPADEAAMQSMMNWREKLFASLSKTDAVAIIDSDPGGYPGSSNEEFINLLSQHRQMLDRIRPGIELYYWLHAGWPGYGRYYQTANFAMSEEAEFLDAVAKLEQAALEPWGLAGNIHYAEKSNLVDRAIDYRYGGIEAEPSFPLTNFGSEGAYLAAQGAKGRGVMGNAQTHCLQLPNTFAFARGAQGLPLTEADYVQFANDLIPGHGSEIVEGWTALHNATPVEKREIADSLESLSQQEIKTGPLAGLLFGDPQRFLMDIVMQLRLQAAQEEFCKASQEDLPLIEPFGNFVAEFTKWQRRHGYEGRAVWAWQDVDAALDKLNDAEINAARRLKPIAVVPFAKVKEEYALAETATSRLVDAMNRVAQEMKKAQKP